MKKIITLSVLSILFIIITDSYSQIIRFTTLEPNNIKSYFYNEGFFDQSLTSGTASGFEWPKGSGKCAIFSAGINISAKVYGKLRQAVSTYRGEFIEGYCIDSVPFYSNYFKFYKVSKWDNQYTNSDWANWDKMVPYGAPYEDVNHNGLFDLGIDKPGVQDAATTIFICLTDGFYQTHINYEPGNFGGGTFPLYSEVHLTAWAYNSSPFDDMQFIKYEIINKGKVPWTNTFITVLFDPDLGQSNDDYIGCDTIRNLGYCYNSANYDSIYGANPPAVGIVFLKGLTDKYFNPISILGMTSFCYLGNQTFPYSYCENGSGFPYFYMRGFKGDSSSWLDVTQQFNGNHFKRTKFCYYGDPESNSGWTEFKGRINNCDMGLNDTGSVIFPNVPGDERIIMSSGAEYLTVNPGDTQTIVLCQLIAQGTSNLNSVTKLKKLSDRAQYFYNENFGINNFIISNKNIPESYSLSQNFPNPFNPFTIIKFAIPETVTRTTSNVKLTVYDIRGKVIATLINRILAPGEYEIKFNGNALSSGIYFYNLNTYKVNLTKKMLMIK